MPTTANHSRRNVIILATTQALSMTGSSALITFSALAGQILAPDKALATLPFALMFVGTMVATIPASLLMGRIGRRAGFTIGQMIGFTAMLISAWGIYHGHFWVFAAGGFLIGTHNAFWQYYRFAAADTASESFRPKAISYVLASGVIAAIAGPELAKASHDLYAPILYAGSFVAMAGLSVASIVLLQFIRIPKPAIGHGKRNSGRPLSVIARQPTVIVAMLSAMLGYGAMSFVMTATPLAMNGCGLSFEDTVFVIQWHVLGMFAPSFFTGNLIKRFGALTIIIIGTLLAAASMVINLMGTDIQNFWLALVLIGVGWNFMFIGGTSLLTETYQPEERAKVQAMNDFAVFSTVAAASFTSGALQNAFGWATVNAAVSLPVLVAFSAAVFLMVRRRSEASTPPASR